MPTPLGCAWAQAFCAPVTNLPLYPYLQAAVRVSGLELGGLVGSLIAGRASDWLIARSPKGGNVGKRVQVRRQGHAAGHVTGWEEGPRGQARAGGRWRSWGDHASGGAGSGVGGWVQGRSRSSNSDGAVLH